MLGKVSDQVNYTSTMLEGLDLEVRLSNLLLLLHLTPSIQSYLHFLYHTEVNAYYIENENDLHNCTSTAATASPAQPKGILFSESSDIRSFLNH